MAGVDFRIDGLGRMGSAPIKIEWLGNVVASRRNAAGVRCVNVVCAPWDATASELPLRQRDVRPFEVRVPVAFLSHLRIGDIWQDGHFAGTQACTEHVFTDLEIGPATTCIVSAKDGWLQADGKMLYELPFDQFDSHATHQRSYLVRVDVAQDQVLLIPVWEVLRFYFGCSGKLMRQLMCGATADEKLYQRVHRDPQSGEVDLHLKPGFGRSAACDIARLAFDPHARLALKALISGGIKASLNYRAFYPRMGLPFQGRTNLTARGRWLLAGGRRVFLVHHLVRCSYPFPFNTLRYHLWLQDRPSTSTFPIAEPKPEETAARPLEGRLSPPWLQDRSTCFPDLASKAVQPVIHRPRRVREEGDDLAISTP